MSEEQRLHDEDKINYQVTEQLDGLPELTYFVALPSVPGGEIHLNTSCVGRLGGETDEDRIFRQDLYARVGAVTVAGGHAEAAMKRVLLTLKGETAKFSTVDLNWTELHRDLVAVGSSGQDERSKRLVETLTWADEMRVKSRRDNVVHAYWWNYAGVGARRARFFRRTDGAMMQGTLDDLAEDSAVIFEYAERLDSLIAGKWPQVILRKVDR